MAFTAPAARTIRVRGTSQYSALGDPQRDQHDRRIGLPFRKPRPIGRIPHPLQLHVVANDDSGSLKSHETIAARRLKHDARARVLNQFARFARAAIGQKPEPSTVVNVVHEHRTAARLAGQSLRREHPDSECRSAAAAIVEYFEAHMDAYGQSKQISRRQRFSERGGPGGEASRHSG